MGNVTYPADSSEDAANGLDSLPAFRANFKQLLHFLGAPEAGTSILEPFLDCCIHFKHWAFSEEKEVRLVAVLNGQAMREADEPKGAERPERPREHFDRNGQRVPYISLFKELEASRPCQLPIRRIIVGPGPSQADREDVLRKLLKELGYSIEVSRSRIPIRF